MPSLRLFLAIETPPEIRPQIAAIRDRLRTSAADVKWEPDEKLHATLKFLGATEERLLPEIVSTIRGVCGRYRPLTVIYSGIGCFPNRRRPRVVWAGLTDKSEALLQLQTDIEKSLEPLGFTKEDREFHAHVTLGRVKSDKRIGSLIRTMESITFESQPVTISEIAVVKSELQPTGSIYSTLESVPLAAV